MDLYALGKQAALAKFALVFGTSEPDDSGVASIPYEHRRGDLESYLKAKSQEEPTSYGRAMGTGGLLGGGFGGLLGFAAGGPAGGLAGTLLGGGLGAGIGGLSAYRDRFHISDAKRTLGKGGTAIDERLRRNILQQRADRKYEEQDRHQEMMDEMRRGRQY